MSLHLGSWQKNAGAASEYFEDLTTELVSGQEPGQWGPGAKLLGLEGPVSLGHFKALAYGKDPTTGQNITLRQKANRRAVLEVVASCPKSFSVAAVLGRDERLVALFERSVAETMEEADSFAAVRVRSAGRDEDAPAKSLVYAMFNHDVSRALDPDLHTHIPIFNMAQDWGSEWRALQTTELFARQRQFTAILNSKLAAGARELGYAVEKTKNGFELAAIPKQVREQFSKGSKKIDKASEKLTGKTKASAAVRSVMAWKTRPDKTKLDEQSLHERWKSEIGGEYDKIKQTVTDARTRKPVFEPRPNAQEIVRDAIECATQNKAVVSEHEVETAALNEANGLLGLIEVRQALAQANGVIFGKADRWGSRKLTTEKALETERRVISITRNGVGKELPLVPTKDKKAFLDKTPERHRKGMSKLLSSRDKVIVLTAEKEIHSIAQSVAEQAGVLVINADKGISVAQLDRALAGEQRVLVLANPTKNPPGAISLLVRSSATTHARCTTMAEIPKWSDIRTLAESWHTVPALSLLEQSGRVGSPSEAVSWAIENDAVVITPNLVEAEKMTASLRKASNLGKDAKTYKVTHQVALNPAEKRNAENYKQGMELRGIRGLGLPTKTATVVKLQGNDIELKTGNGPNIVVDLSHLPSSARWTVNQTKELEIRAGDKLLLGKTGQIVTIAEFKNGEPVSENGFAISINDSVSYGWAVPEATPVKAAKVAVVGATSRIGLCRALGRGQIEAKLFTTDILELREKLFRNGKTAGSILQATPYPRLAINQQRLIEQCWTPAKAVELVKAREITQETTPRNLEKTPVSAREQGQGHER